MSEVGLRVAFGSRLKSCNNVVTLGVKPNFSDYSSQEQDLIRNARKIYYPTSFYADLFDTMGKPIFPSYHTYMYAQDKIKQSALFDLLKIDHPKTRVFYGKKQKQDILRYFKFPFIAKVPRGSALGEGVFLIRNANDLENYVQACKIAYIQEYMPIKQDLRVVVIGNKVALAYWRIALEHEYRSNVARGANIIFDNIPQIALEFARSVARLCKWDDVGIDICQYNHKFYVLEANMKYGRQGFYKAGIDYMDMMEKMIENNDI